MEIGRISRNNTVSSELKVQAGKKDFSQNFNQARDRKSQEQLKKLMDDIQKKGNRLVITKTYIDVVNYKKMIKEYLESVLKHMYDTKKDISFWQTQYFITVDKIDTKLEELTSGFFNGEIENINVAATIDEIQGLIVDIYR